MTAPVPDEQAASDTTSRFSALRNWAVKRGNESAYWSFLIAVLGWSIVSPESWWGLAFFVPAVLLADHATGLIKMHSSRNVRLRAELARVQEEANTALQALAEENERLRAGLPAAYVNGDDGYLALHHEDCDGHVAFIEAGDDLAGLVAKLREHTCEAAK